MIDFELKIESLTLNWINRLINNPGNWQAVPCLLKNKISSENWLEFFVCNINYDKYIDKNYSYFYSMCSLWKRLKNKNISQENILFERIWLNESIKMNKNHIIWPEWRDKGIEYIGDIIDSNFNFKTMEDLNNEYDINFNQM